ncbi:MULTISPECIES: hypothetical protein [Sphingomonas]|uniref:hypothetical protein n=1 Tax=Sphingomonas TaxID=13687 RepID=UPI00126A0645|nr:MULTISPECIES: hypothetical protein [Sphingomonas]
MTYYTRITAARTKDLTGKRYGKLVAVVQLPSRDKQGRPNWLCLCDCGSTTLATASALHKRKSCGCLKRRPTGASPAERETLLMARRNMLKRCYVEGSEGYSRYGERGITVCQEWRDDKEAFYDWALANGWTPELQIDRIDNDGDYEPSNCHFVTRLENARKTSRTVMSIATANDILELRRRGLNPKAIASTLGIKRHHVDNVIYRGSWTDNPKKHYQPRRRGRPA